MMLMVTEEQGLDWLTERLYLTGRFKKIERHVPWSNNGHEGEYDLLATTHKNLREYYEWKNSNGVRAGKRADDQFLRSFLYARGGRGMNYVAVSPKSARRWRK